MSDTSRRARQRKLRTEPGLASAAAEQREVERQRGPGYVPGSYTGDLEQNYKRSPPPVSDLLDDPSGQGLDLEPDGYDDPEMQAWIDRAEDEGWM
jgi:hypothetical protein